MSRFQVPSFVPWFWCGRGLYLRLPGFGPRVVLAAARIVAAGHCLVVSVAALAAATAGVGQVLVLLVGAVSAPPPAACVAASRLSARWSFAL